MDLKDRRKKGWGRFFRSFRYASRGLRNVFLEEQNIQLHLSAAAIAIIMAFVFSIPLIHWMILIIVIGGMFALEIINTAIERVVDLITEEYHPSAELAKDIAAAAVFVYSIAAIVVGVLLFYQPIVSLLFTN
ncbi:diacylglycerol kinase family protein [Salibacterium salarium]|uniref:Diacylglycerol kinase family protein n=2 Tax=Salibacterium salarium TaxID=284579 RepID=A0A428MXV1_9BACI|nr:diacylglycerol kinase family protein [Salibacterium salarium]RSL30965.1 diacylglycerol kinase family protein [Salibacterium salarium]